MSAFESNDDAGGDIELFMLAAVSVSRAVVRFFGHLSVALANGGLDKNGKSLTQASGCALSTRCR